MWSKPTKQAKKRSPPPGKTHLVRAKAKNRRSAGLPVKSVGPEASRAFTPDAPSQHLKIIQVQAHDLAVSALPLVRSTRVFTQATLSKHAKARSFVRSGSCASESGQQRKAEQDSHHNKLASQHKIRLPMKYDPSLIPY